MKSREQNVRVANDTNESIDRYKIKIFVGYKYTSTPPTQNVLCEYVLPLDDISVSLPCCPITTDFSQQHILTTRSGKLVSGS